MKLRSLNTTKEISCEWWKCLRTFTNPNDCYNHCRKVHVIQDTRKCQWKDCRMTSSTRCNLTNHLLTHIPVVNGVCYVCDREFKWKCDFKRHISKHNSAENRFNNAAKLLFN